MVSHGRMAVRDCALVELRTMLVLVLLFLLVLQEKLLVLVLLQHGLERGVVGRHLGDGHGSLAMRRDLLSLAVELKERTPREGLEARVLL